MRGDKSAVGLRGHVVKGLRRNHATVPDQIRFPSGLLEFEHFDRFATAMVDHEELHRAVFTFQQRDSMRPKRVADGTGTRGITPVLAGLRAGRHLGKYFLRGIEQHDPSNSGTCRAAYELAYDHQLA